MDRWLLCLALAGTTVWATSACAAAQEPDRSPDAPAPSPGTPGPAHAWLTQLEGPWEVVDDGRVVGTATGRERLGGRFLELEIHSRAGPARHAVYTFGYDDRHDEYTVTARDDAGTYAVHARGAGDRGAGRVVMRGTDDDPVMAAMGLEKAFAIVLDRSSPDRVIIQTRLVDTRTPDRREIPYFSYQLVRRGSAAAHQPRDYVEIQHPEWSRSATLYQINTRQFTPEGTFRSAVEELPRLKALGADILWLMPVHPIGEVERKGSLGSPYAVRDYYGVNPEFGTLEDLEAFVDRAHELGMYVILDWVANHTAWDNPLTDEHPGWYERDWKGDFRPTPWWDWSDIIDLDYTRPEVRRYMADAMKYWVAEVDVDGFRADVAGFVPVDFWEEVRRELEAVKPVFMLAEWESRDLHARAFDATYAWSWYDAVHRIVRGQADVSRLYVYYSWDESAYPPEAMRMAFVSNHDKNAWEATQFEAFGDGLEAAIVLSVVGDHIPLIYNGQEAGNPRRLAFFEKDPIAWREHPVGDLYRDLFALKHENTALHNAPWGATMVRIPNDAETRVLSFVRQNERDRVVAVFNFSDRARETVLGQGPYAGEYTDPFGGEAVRLEAGSRLSLPPWGWRVFTAAADGE